MGFWSKLGGIAKIAVPIALAATGVGAPLAAGISAATNVAGSKMQGKSWKGSLIDGMMGGATGALGSLGAAKGAAQGGFMNGLKKVGANVGGNFLTSLMNPDTIGELGRGLGAAANTAANNRGTELDAMLEADRQEAILRRDRRDEESDLWKKLQAADYMKAGGMGPQKPVMTAFGPSSVTSNIRPISAGNKAMAATLETQLLNKLRNPSKARDYDSKMKPGTGENVMNWLSPIASVASSAMRNRQGGTDSSIPAPPPTLDVTRNMRPRIGSTDVPKDPTMDWLLNGIPGTGPAKPPTFTL